MQEEKKKERILVIDDDPLLLELIEEILLRHGYQIHLAVGGKMALGLTEFIKDDFDLLLTDVVMPDIRGEEVALLLKEIYPNAKVLFMSAYLKPSIEKYEEQYGRVDFILKPFTPKKLVGKVRKILA